MIHYLAIRLNEGLCIEWSLSIQHLVHADTKRPPVALWSIETLTVLHCTQDFRGDVVWGANSHS